MIENLPIWIDVLFIATFVLTIGLFHLSNGKPKKLTLIILIWSVIQALLAYTGFYQNMNTVPPRFGLVLIPAFGFIIYGLLPAQRKWALANRNIQFSTLLHSIRLPIEIVLYGLFINEMIPELMTFEGRNFDIIMGITAPVVGFVYWKKAVNVKTLLIWNILGLGLVSFILFNGILSAELPFQQFEFDQPNRGITFFPFILLPATIVPIVIWTHLSDIIILVRELKTK